MQKRPKKALKVRLVINGLKVSNEHLGYLEPYQVEKPEKFSPDFHLIFKPQSNYRGTFMTLS